MPLIEADIDIAKELASAESETVNLDAPQSEPAPEPEQATPDEPVEQKADESDHEDAEKVEKPAEQGQKKENRGDPAIALRIARKEAKELKEQLRKQSADHQAAVQQLAERLNTLTNPPKAKPSFEEDPLTHLKTELDETKAKSAQIEQIERVRQFEQQVQTALQGYEAEFQKENPDYQDAAGHVVKAIAANMELLGVPQDQINSQIRQQIMQITVNAARAGKDPAEVVYGMAKNLGYTSKAKADAVASQQKLDTIAKGQQASQSLGSGAKSEVGKLTLDVLAKMDDDDFNALLLDDKKWSEIGRLMH